MALAYHHHHQRREPNKLRKLSSPPSSFSFHVDELPSSSNFPYSFPQSRPVTVLSFSQQSSPPNVSAPTRKLTKSRRSVPELTHPPVSFPTITNPPKRRSSLNINLSLNLRRRLSSKKEKQKLELESEPLPESIPVPSSVSPTKPKIFTLDDELHDIQYDNRPRQRPTLPFTFSDSSHSGSAESASSSKRRWTLAMAMTDHDIPDEVFVAEIERIRRENMNIGHGWNWEWGLPDDPDAEYIIESPTSSDDGFTYSSHGFHFGPSAPELGNHGDQDASMVARVYRAPTDPGAHYTSDKTWSSALRALLITRDLLRTERNYLASLKVLLESSPCNAIMTPGEFGFLSRNVMGQSDSQLLYPLAHVSPPSDYLSASTSKPSLPWPSHPPPPLMHTYLSALVAVSTIFVSRLEADPTISGAARAFIGCSSEASSESLELNEDIETLERVFVGWCGVVGGWFQDDPKEKEKRQRRKLSKSRSSVRANHELPYTRESPSRTESGFFEAEKERDGKEWRSNSAVSLFKRHTTYSSSSAHSHSDPHSTNVEPSTPTSPTFRLRNIACRSPSLSLAQSRWRKSMPSVSSSIPSQNSPPFSDNTSRPYSTFDPPSPQEYHFAGQRSATVGQNLHLNTNLTFTPVHPQNHSRTVTSPYNQPSASSSSTCTPTVPTPTRGSPSARAMGFGRRAAEREEKAAIGRSQWEKLQLTRGRTDQEKALSASSHVTEIDSSPSGKSSENSVMLNGKRVHSVRELAILPVQRVTRYVLLYRDILKHTPPTSPSRALLERAAETATRIAQKCDRAQENSKFLWSPRA
ncbi:hypothetical protein VKT23_005471 [Stygiomarasmius scandens]|uniref:DH domain-containing protein n=1 Tax=Marasmiellus scandens TaxID=2682957 RepID=A0ABR1JTI7_9AGAR